MLPRSDSTVSSNLERTRSTTSVKERRKHPLRGETINPETARNHALIAAHRAFDRSRASTSTDLMRSESTVSRRSNSSYQSQGAHFSPGTYLRRQRSTLQTRVPRLADTLQLPGTAPCIDVKHLHPNAHSGIQGENYGAEPSSYRKLRRSRSSLSPRHRTFRQFQRSPDPFWSEGPRLRTSRSFAALSPSGLKIRLKKSIDLLRHPHGLPERSITAPICLSSVQSPRPEAVALARSQFLQDNQPLESCLKSLTPPSSKVKQAQKVFRKTFRANHMQTSDNHLLCHDDEDSKYPRLEKRSISTSISDKVKKIFGRSRLEGQVPSQQVQASRAHFGTDTTAINLDAGFDSYHECDMSFANSTSPCMTPRLEQNISDVVVQPPHQLSRVGSCESISSNSKSRVTSWTNSTATASTATQSGTYEQKRLSIIKEDGGPHQPSSSVGRHIGGVSVFQQPLQCANGQKIDSQRIYSALMKRIDEEQKEMENTQAALKEIHDARDQDSVVGHYLFSSPTIRKVDSVGSVSETNPEMHEHQPTDAARTDSRNQDQKLSNIGLRESSNQNQYGAAQQQTSSSSFSASSRRDNGQDRIACPNTLEDTNACTTVLKAQVSSTDNGLIVAKRNRPNRCFSNNRFEQSTDSVYSRTTNGGTNPDYVSPVASTDDFGDALAIEDRIAAVLHPNQIETSATEIPPTRLGTMVRNSTCERGAWQNWMALQMQTLDTKKLDTRSTYHVREHAQIDPGETEIGMASAHRLTRQVYPDSTPKAGSKHATFSGPHTDNNATTPSAPESGRSLLPVLGPEQAYPDHNATSRQNASMKCRHSILFDQKNSDGGTLQQRRGSGLGKAPSENVTRVLTGRKSQPTLSRQSNSGKENSPVYLDDSPPLSTPGRHHLQMRNGCSTGRLRKGKSKGYSPSDNGQESPCDKPRSTLSARLSKPFDMDIPDRNRPFDSMYLGKRDTGNGSRLSVAVGEKPTPRTKTYGDLGTPPFQSSRNPMDSDRNSSPTTALPSIPAVIDTAQRSTSGVSLKLATRRLVSSFLKGRTKLDDAMSPARNGSPAFI